MIEDNDVLLVQQPEPGGRFFMPQSTLQLHVRPFLCCAFLLMISMIVGCARHADDALLTDAQEERAAASMRLAKAVARYCAVSTDSLRARDTCMTERLSFLYFEQAASVHVPLGVPHSTARE